MSKKIVIIGGGPAGVEAALEAKKAGSTVTVVSDAPIGGRAGWHSLLPSKVWLSAADLVGAVNEIDTATAKEFSHNLSPAGVVQHIARIKRNWNQGLELSLIENGIDIIQGTASFVEESKIEVRQNEGDLLRIVEGDAFIVADRSVPIFPPDLKPDGKQVIAPRFASQLSNLPKSMIVVGAGPTGCESAYLFNRFGVEVSWIVDQFGILPQMHQDLGHELGRELVRQGIHIVQGQMVERLERGKDVTAVLADGARYKAEMAFVAVGRRPDWARLNLAAAGLAPDAEGQIDTNGFGRVEKSRIYLIGDAAGGALIANKAMAQARIAGRHAAGAAVSDYDPNLVVHVTYTDPQAAQIGDVSKADGVKLVRVPYSAALKAHLVDNQDGFLGIFYDATDLRLWGAMALGSHAADVLAPIAVGLRMGATLNQLADIYAPHPTLSELPFIAARTV